MTVNSGALVEPSIARGRIDAHQQYVAAACRREVCEIKTEWIVSSAMTADVEVVEHHHGFAIRAIELHRDALAFGFGRQLEHAAIPTDTGGWILLSQWKIGRASCRERVWIT